MISDNMQWGIEIEFAGDNNIRNNINRIWGSNGMWYCGTDHTASFIFKRGLELRNAQPFFTNNFDVWNELLDILNYIKSNGGEMSGKAGVHIHFSRPNGFSQERLDNIEKRLIQYYEKGVQARRKVFCFSTDRYVPLRKVHRGHYEARVFNGTLNLRAIKNYFRVLMKIINEKP